MGNVAAAGGLLLLVLLPLLPPLAPITSLGMGRVGLLAFATLWWVAAPVPLPVTTIAALAWGVLTGVLSPAEAFAADAGGIVWFIIGAFGLSAALEANGFSRRSRALVREPAVGAGTAAARCCSRCGHRRSSTSSVMSNVVVVMVFLPLVVGDLLLAGTAQGRSRFAETNTMGLAWMANIGGIVTPIGTPTNALGIGLIATATGRSVGFLDLERRRAWSRASLLTLAAFVRRPVCGASRCLGAWNAADHRPAARATAGS